jgi:sensor histidine kinase regulating citrate/malate metabolism
MARVEIEDNGQGVPSELEPVLFERPAESGLNHSGYGLIIVRFLIEQYGGQVGFGPSKNGQGACFFFTLPVVRRAP